MRAKKAFRVDDSGRLRFLFHAHDGSSIVPLGVWLESKGRLVRDGDGRRYRAGFHFFPADADTKLFNVLTKNKYQIIEVEVEDVRPKTRSSVGSWIAKRLRVPLLKEVGR